MTTAPGTTAPVTAPETTAPVTTAPVTTSPMAPSSTEPPLSPRPPKRLSSRRRAALIGLPALLVVLLVTAIALTLGSGRAGLLDPDAVDPSGSRALAQVLRSNGVHVDVVTTTSAALTTVQPSTTLLMVFPERLALAELTALAGSRAGTLIVVGAGPRETGLLVPGLTAIDTVPDVVQLPGCTVRAAEQAGELSLPGFTYRWSPKGSEPGRPFAQGCYRDIDGAALMRVTTTRPDGSQRTAIALGSDVPLQNQSLDASGNAALVLGLLGDRPQVVWLRPELAPMAARATLSELLPPWIGWVELQLIVTVLLVAVWRGRRFGRLVNEPLPVVVRAAEAVEGRGRLYRRARARDRAADHLRRATLGRLAMMSGSSRLPYPDQLSAVSAAVAERTGNDATLVNNLLHGAAPGNDVALVRLARDLDDLERQARRP